MKRFILIIILILNLQSLSKADDIRDFQIEEMSIGDSLLDYFNKEKITNNIQEYYNDDEYSAVVFASSSVEYDFIQIHFKTYDKKFIIHSLDGIFKIESIKSCIKKKDKIAKEISEVFSSLTKEARDGWNMASGQGKLYGVMYKFSSGDFIEVVCYEYKEELKKPNHGRVAIVKKDLDDWIVYKAHK